MMRRASGMATLLASLSVAAAGCGRELLGADEERISPNAELRAPVETPEPPKAPQDVDESGRLLPADGLVSGFEVPKGLKLLRREGGYLEFEINAEVDALREFWSGLDSRNGRRFAERRYLIEDATVGFDVNHSRETLDRLRLGEEYKDGYIYVAPGGGRSQRIRVHPPMTVVDPEDNPFIPKLEPAGPGSPLTPRGTPPPSRLSRPRAPTGAAGENGRVDDEGASSNGTQTGGRRGSATPEAGGSGLSPAPTGTSPTGPAPTGPAPTGTSPTGPAPTGPAPTGTSPTGPAPTGPAPTGTAPTGTLPSAPGLVPTNPRPLPPSLTPTGLVPQGGTPAKKYGPYPGAGHSVVPEIRQWQAQNPGTQFLD